MSSLLYANKRELRELQKYIRNIPEVELSPLKHMLKEVSVGTILTNVGKEYINKHIGKESSDTYIIVYKVFFNISIMIDYKELLKGLIEYHSLIVDMSEGDNYLKTVLSACTGNDMLPGQVVLFLLLILK